MKSLRNTGLLSLLLFSILACESSTDTNNYRESLKGHWKLMSGKWHSGMMITKDSIFVMSQYDKIWRPIGGKNLGEPYKLTKEDSLIFGSSNNETTNTYGLNKGLTGYWKIIELTPDTLTVKSSLGLLQFRRIEGIIDKRFLELD